MAPIFPLNNCEPVVLPVTGSAGKLPCGIPAKGETDEFIGYP